VKSLSNNKNENLFLTVTLLSIFFVCHAALAKTLHVGANKNIKTIQGAVIVQSMETPLW
jgi:hypothetical protein